MYLRRLHFALVALILSSGTVFANDAEETRLATSFCESLVGQAGGDPGRLAKEESLWTAFLSRVETTPGAKPAESVEAALAACHAVYDTELEEGEFILKGRTLLARHIYDESQTGGEDTMGELSWTDLSQLGRIELPEFGSLPLKDEPSHRLVAVPASAPVEPLAELRHRSAHYNALWQEYVESLRRRLLEPSASVKWVKSLK